MDNKQANCTRITRASKKRAFASSIDHSQIPSTKKRVVLGELTNFPTNNNNIRSTPVLGFGDNIAHRPNPQLKNTKEKKTEVKELEKTEVVSGEDDSQKCGYVPLIYLHLHSLEV